MDKRNSIDLEKKYEKFMNELKQNDKLVAKEFQEKSQNELAQDLINFVKNNECKILGESDDGSER